MKVNYEKEYKNLLKNCNLWPMSSWNHFLFEHKSPQNKTVENLQIEGLKNAFIAKTSLKLDGVYAYKKNGVWIYVGKGKPIIKRLISHYRESFRVVPGDTKDNLWHHFFKDHQGILKIYWQVVKFENDRRILELALQSVLNPVFESYRNKFNQN